MNKERTIVGFIPLSRIYSGNELYKYRTKKGTSKVWVTKHPHCKEMQIEIMRRLGDMPLPFAPDVLAYQADVEVVDRWRTKDLRWRKKDLSNSWKGIEDGIAMSFGVDDSLCTKLTLTKVNTFNKNDVGVRYTFTFQTKE